MGLITLIPIIGELIEKVIPDPNKKAEIQLELAKLASAESQRESNEAIAQIQVNQQQAGNASLFVSGPRPALMWTGVAALAWEAGIAPILGSLGVHTVHVPSEYFSDILWFTAGLCGIRGYEKVKGVARDSLTENPEPSKPTGIVQKVKQKVGGAWPF